MSTPTPSDPVYDLPLATNIAIFLTSLALSTVVALWLSHYYARKGLSTVARLTVIISYITAFMALFVTFMDVTGGYHSELKPIWKMYYIFVSVGCWGIVPLQQAYHDNGGFTFVDKAKSALKDEGIYYGIVLSVASVLLLYIVITTDLTSGDITALVLALANTFGFILLTLFFGSGLVNLPLAIWNRSNRESGLHFCLYKLGKLNDKMQSEQDKLQQTNQYIELLAQNCPTQFTPLLDIIRSKLPPPTSYEFAFIGSSTGTEAHGPLEKLQKLSFSDLKRKQFIALHYIVINHRRTLGMFQTEWKDTIDRYLYLNQVALLRAQYPKMSQLPSQSFIAPGEGTYSNFPGSFLWVLPCCCGEKDDGATTSSIFAEDAIAKAGEGSNLSDLTLTMSSPHAQSQSNSPNQAPISGPNQPNQDDIIKRTQSMLNANYESNTASTMDQNGDIFDDMASRHNSNLNTLGLKYQVQQKGARLGTWLFRKPPVLTPGTMYYRFTWVWYKFVIYIEPWFLRAIALTLGALSCLLMWCEIAIVLSHKLSPLYYLTHTKSVSSFTLMIFRVLPLCYIVLCIYYTIFNINLGWWFHMQSRQRTSEFSILFSCSCMLRTIFTTTFNYYQMCNITGTAFLEFTGKMTVIPLLGSSFEYVMPLFVALFAVLTMVNCWAWFMKLLGVPHFNFSMRSKESEAFLGDGRVLVDRYQRRLKGERVDHFRSKELDSRRLKDLREKRKQNDPTHPQRVPRESVAIKAIKDREERERAEREDRMNAANGGQVDVESMGVDSSRYTGSTAVAQPAKDDKKNWNSKPMPNKFNKYHSQGQAKTNLNDF